MISKYAGVLLFLLMLGLVACGQNQSQPVPTPVQAAELAASPTKTGAAADTAVPSPTTTSLPTLLPSPTTTTVPSPTLSPSATLSPTPSPTLTATPDPYAAFTIEALSARDYGAGELEIIDTLERNDRFARYLIRYPSDELTIYGYMNVPNEGVKFPVAIVLHGYIPPSEYETVAYTQRYADALAEAGFFVIHPNFRNYPPSDSGPDYFRTGFAIDVLNLIEIMRTQSQDAEGPLRRADAENIHLWGHSMGGGVTLRVITVNNAPYIKAAVLYGSMSGDEALNYGRIRGWSNRSRGDFELAASAESLAAISPIHHLERINAPISIHHSDADERVPVEWSQDLCLKLEALGHPVECFIYNGAPHTFIPPWDDVFMARMLDFYSNN